MNDFHDGCQRLIETMNGWLAAYTQKLCSDVVDGRHPRSGDYCHRLWLCWRHHWRQAVDVAEERKVNGIEVAKAVQNGRGFLRGGRLGGDPLRDVVLAEAVVCGDEGAIQCFLKEYTDYARRVARRRNPALASDDGWWGELFDQLRGGTQPPGTLAQYSGQSSLKDWLGPTVVRFVIRTVTHDVRRLEKLRKWAANPSSGFGQPESGPSDDSRPDEEMMSRECEDLFARPLRDAMQTLCDAERLLLKLLYVDQLKGKDVAGMLGINPGNVTRRKMAVASKLRKRLAEQMGDDAQTDESPAMGGPSPIAQSYQDCLGHLFAGSPARFSAMVHEVLTDEV